MPCTADTLWRPAPAPATRRTSASPAVTATWKLPTRLLHSAALATLFRSALANQACMSSSNGGGASRIPSVASRRNALAALSSASSSAPSHTITSATAKSDFSHCLLIPKSKSTQFSVTDAGRVVTPTFRPFAKKLRRCAPLVPQNTSQSFKPATMPAGVYLLW